MAIYYFCPYSSKPNGGNKQIYRHVEALHAAGFEAYVLTTRADNQDWFRSAAPVAVLKTSRLQRLEENMRWGRLQPTWLRAPVGSIVAGSTREWLKAPVGAALNKRSRDGRMLDSRLSADDIIVMPEFYGKGLGMPGFGARLVIFNQNAHYTYAGFRVDDDLAAFPYLNRQLLGVLAVSDHIERYLRFAFPGLSVQLVRNGVDTALFRPTAGKKRQIAFMPRKLSRDLIQVLQMLRGRGSLEGWSLAAIDNMTEGQVAAVMSESAFFLSTCECEGFGLPPLEAAASGCIVVGYTGYAAREFMLPTYCHPVDQGDVLGLASTLETLLLRYDREPEQMLARATDHARFVHAHYSSVNEATGVVKAWTQWLGGAR